MYRPFLFFVIFFIPGIMLGNSVKAAGMFIVISIISFAGSILIKNKKARMALLAMAIVFFGAFYYDFRLDKMVGTVADFAEQQQTLIGMVSDVPTVKQDKVVYDVKALYLLDDEKYKVVTGKVRLSSLLDDESIIYRYGDVIKFSGKLKLPQGRRNPNGIDYKAYLLQKGISASIFSQKIAKIGRCRTNPFISTAFRLRENLTSFYESCLPPNLSSLMVGIALGIKDNIPAETMKAVKNGGVAHVLAVSGLHTGIIYAALEMVFSRLGLSNILSFIIGSTAIIFYSFMAGLSPSVIRAAIMIIVFMLAKVVGRKNDPINTLCLSATFLLFVNPLTLFSISFQLSYAAVLGIMLFFDPLKLILEKLPGYLRDSITVMVSAQLTVWPFLAYYFNSISLIGFITNILVIPLVSIILISGLISGVIGLLFTFMGSLFMTVPGFLLKIVEKIILVSSQLPFSTIIVPAIPPISIVLYFMFLVLMFDFAPSFGKIELRHKRFCAVILMFLALIPVIMPLKVLEVTFIDVGQGDSILIQTKSKKVVLIDGGGTPVYYNGDFDTGEDIIMPLLYSKGINKIDVLVFTHFDDDHAKGLLSILNSMKVKSIVYGVPEDCAIFKEMIKIAQQKQIKTIQVGRGDQFIIDDAIFDVINPVKNEKTNYSSNNGSVVLKMNYKGISFLFTGDLEYEGEQSLISSEIDISSDVLKIGHHGSQSSTSEEFISKVKPSYGIISVGKDNNFGHPSPQVIELLKNGGVTVLRTDFSGAVSFKISDSSVKIYTTIPEELKEP